MRQRRGFVDTLGTALISAHLLGKSKSYLDKMTLIEGSFLTNLYVTK